MPPSEQRTHTYLKKAHSIIVFIRYVLRYLEVIEHLFEISRNIWYFTTQNSKYLCYKISYHAPGGYCTLL